MTNLQFNKFLNTNKTAIVNIIASLNPKEASIHLMNNKTDYYDRFQHGGAHFCTTFYPSLDLKNPKPLQHKYYYVTKSITFMTNEDAYYVTIPTDLAQMQGSKDVEYVVLWDNKWTIFNNSFIRSCKKITKKQDLRDLYVVPTESLIWRDCDNNWNHSNYNLAYFDAKFIGNVQYAHKYNKGRFFVSIYGENGEFKIRLEATSWNQFQEFTKDLKANTLQCAFRQKRHLITLRKDDKKLFVFLGEVEKEAEINKEIETKVAELKDKIKEKEIVEKEEGYKAIEPLSKFEKTWKNWKEFIETKPLTIKRLEFIREMVEKELYWAKTIL